MKRYILTLFLLLTGTMLFAQAPATVSFDVDGIKVIFKPTIKDVISVRMFFRGGVADYTTEQAGIEQLTLGATAECGTKKYDANQFRDIADKYGVEIGGSADYDYGNLDMVCVSKYFDQGWDLFTEAVMNPVFDANEVEMLKNKLIAGIKQEETDPDSRISQLVMMNAYKGTIYAANPKGTERSVNSLTAEALRNYYRQIFNKNRMFIVVAGKISKAELEKKIKASFGAIPATPYKPLDYRTPYWNDNKLLVENKALATNYINAIMNAPVMSDEDYIPFHMGISAFSGTLFSEIRTKRNLSYSPGAYAANLQMPYAMMYVSTSYPKDAITVMMDELNRIKRVGITSSGLKELKSSYITSSYVKAQESNAITSNLGIAEVMGGWELFEQTPDKVEAVTADQISKALNKYITGVRWSYLGDTNLAKEAEGAFRITVR